MLAWGRVGGIVTYEYCYDTINNGVCDGSWISVGSSTSIGLTGLNKNATYYWQVRAINSGGTTYADAGAWWSFTTGVKIFLPFVMK